MVCSAHSLPVGISRRRIDLLQFAAKDMGSTRIRETYRMLIEAVYSKWNSDKIGDVPRRGQDLSGRFQGQAGRLPDVLLRTCFEASSWLPRMSWQPMILFHYSRATVLHMFEHLVILHEAHHLLTATIQAP